MLINTKKAFVLSNGFGWFSEFCREMAKYYTGLGYNVVPFKASEIESLVKNKELTIKTPFKATAGVTRKIFDLLGIPQPKNLDIPDFILDNVKLQDLYLGRRVKRSTLGAVQKHLIGKKKIPGLKASEMLHIKPLEIQKAFCGMVAYEEHIKDLYSDGYPKDFPVLAADFIKIDSEQRFWVYRNYLTYASNGQEYNYDLKKFAHNIVELVRDKIEKRYYTFDVGMSGGKPILVEFNEPFSAGKGQHISWGEYCETVNKRLTEITGEAYYSGWKWEPGSCNGN